MVLKGPTYTEDARDIRPQPKLTESDDFYIHDLAGEPGFEPRSTESESAVLPLNYSPARANRRAVRLVCGAYKQKPDDCKYLF